MRASECLFIYGNNPLSKYNYIMYYCASEITIHSNKADNLLRVQLDHFGFQNYWPLNTTLYPGNQ